MRPRRRALCVAIILLSVAWGARADNAQTLAPSLPTGRFDATAAVVDGVPYVFGGYPPTDEIVAFAPGSGSVAVLATRLPRPLWAASAVSTGSEIILFGGRANGWPGTLDDIMHFDPGLGTLRASSAALPWPIDYASAVWTGSEALLFGGYPYRDTILRYDPKTEEIALASARLPSARASTSAVWDGQHAYVFGGRGNDGRSIDEILRYDPIADELTVLSARLPSSRLLTAAVWDGEAAYIAGGLTGLGYTDEIVRFEPTHVRVATMTATLPSTRSGMAAASLPPGAYFFGGARCCGRTAQDDVLDDIVRYDLSPGPPRLVRALPGAHAGRIEVSWEPPSPDTYSAPITAYRVYRAAGAGPAERVGEVGDVRSFTDEAPSVGLFVYTVRAVNSMGEGAPSLPAPAPGASLAPGFDPTSAAKSRTPPTGPYATRAPET